MRRRFAPRQRITRTAVTRCAYAHATFFFVPVLCTRRPCSSAPGSGETSEQVCSYIRLSAPSRCSTRRVDAAAHRLPLHAIKEFMPEQRIGGSVFTPPFYAMALAEDAQTRAHLLTRWKHAGIYYGMIRPQGRGRVASLPACTEPLVSYRHGPRDMAALAEIAGRLAEFLFAAGARYIIPSISGHAGWSSADEARRELLAGLPKGRTNLMSIHLFSSCPPGKNDTLTATDSFGRVWGSANIIVADASQIPEAPGCNPQGTVMAIAFRNAEAFLARRRAHV